MTFAVCEDISAQTYDDFAAVARNREGSLYELSVTVVERVECAADHYFHSLLDIIVIYYEYWQDFR